MTAAGGALAYRRLHAPRGHGETLVEPPLAAAPDLLARNTELLLSHRADLGGRSFAQLAAAARRDVIQAAREYSGAYRAIPEQSATGRVILAGHQPELFHPGVWFKNFALDRLARSCGATPLNLIVDNDLPRLTSVRCPVVTPRGARVERVPFDVPDRLVPYEQAAVRDLATFDRFGARLAATLRPLIDGPLVRDFWPLAQQAVRERRLLGRSLAQARHVWEQRWGLETLELPMSRICDGPEFRWFALFLLLELPRLHRHYNAALAEYRQLHRLRSRTHPVSDLERFEEWLEAPFWIWSDAWPQRRRLFVRRRQDHFELTDRGRLRLALPWRGNRFDDALATWEAARGAGLKIRPRALLTTMYARLVLGDLFLHGIGGAKYDQLTDAIIRRQFECEPPAFLTLTATVLLPVPRTSISVDDLRWRNRLLRELRYHPEKHVGLTEHTRELVAAKQRWIAGCAAGTSPQQRHQELHRLNQQLQPFVEPARQQVLAERAALELQLHDAAILGSREYAFCLFPESTLRGLLLDLARKQP